MQRPAAGDISRADDQVKPVERREDARHEAGGMGEIGIHGQNRIIARRHRPFHACNVRRAKPELAGTVDGMNPPVAVRQLGNQRTGAIGRVVVHYDNHQRGHIGVELLEQRNDIVALVVGGDDDSSAHHRQKWAERLWSGRSARLGVFYVPFRRSNAQIEPHRNWC